jgi:hypothetical protein
MKIQIPTVIKIIIVLLSFTKQADAKIWRINNAANATNGSNYGGTAAYPVFQQLFGTASNSANGSNLVITGDTVHLEGSSLTYAGGSLSKKIVIIGQGYFLNSNPYVSTNILSTVLASIHFITGSTGSQLIGVNVGDNNNGGGIDISVSDLLIQRCRIEYDISIDANMTDIRIVQNFFSRVSATTALSINAAGSPIDLIFNNNIVLGTLILPVGFTVLECKNNVFAGPSIAANPSIRMNVGSFQNNILTNPAATVNINGGTNLNVAFNTGSSATQFGTLNNNVVIADMTTLFVASGTSDGKYQLKPASDLGADGTERGAFGGISTVSRYTLSGLAPIPVIYDIATSGVADATGLPVTIKARIIK